MTEIQTIEQVEAEHPSEWVLIDEPEVDESLRVKSGRVVFHSLDREEFDRKAIELKLPYSAIYYFGKLPDDTALIL